MPAFELRDLEFMSDGNLDSLTLSMAPALFHENLKREISTALREARELTIVSLQVNPDGFASLSLYQEALIEIAHHLRTQLRGGDFFSRISDQGFWILLRTDLVGAKLVVERLNLAHHEKISINFVVRGSHNYSEWISTVDQIHFA